MRRMIITVPDELYEIIRNKSFQERNSMNQIINGILEKEVKMDYDYDLHVRPICKGCEYVDLDSFKCLRESEEDFDKFLCPKD